jgi:protein SCO1/2
MNLPRLVSVGLGCAISVAAYAQYQSGNDINPDVVLRDVRMKQIGIDQRLGQKVQALATFTDESGKSLAFSSLLGKRPIIILPIFYRCTGVCNLELNGVEQTAKEMADRNIGKDFDVVALGINPKEGPELANAKRLKTLREYDRPGTEKGWHFLTGNMENIRAMTNSLGFKFAYDEAKDQVNHPSGIMVLTKDGTISSYLLGANYTSEKLGGFLDTAAKGEVGQKSRELFFGCVHLDPITGARSIVIENVLKVLGVITIAALLSTMIYLSKRAKSPFERALKG